MEKEIFYMHEVLSNHPNISPLDMKRDIAFASLWFGMKTDKHGTRLRTGISNHRIKKGITLLKEHAKIARYVFLTGPDKEEMLTFVMAQKPKDVLAVKKDDFAIRLAMEDSLKPSDRIFYLSELNGVIFSLHRRGLVVFENQNMRRGFNGETVDIYQLLSAIPDLTYEDYALIQLLKSMEEDVLDKVYPYLESTLIQTALNTIENTWGMDGNTHRDIFQSLIQSNPMARIHHLPFHIARLLAS